MNALKKILLFVAILLTPAMAGAQTAAPVVSADVTAPLITPPVKPVVAAPTAAVAADATTAPAKSKDGSLPGYTPMKPDYANSVGMPKNKQMDFQEQFTENGEYAKWINNALLLPIITVISLFVLALLFLVVIRFRKNVNPVPSKTTHNTAIEIAWTLIPVLILLGIAYPSLDLLAKQFKPAPKGAVTVKAIGNQWNWTYQYPDHGDFKIDSYMLKEKEDTAKGERYRTDDDGPELLAPDNRMVVPYGVPLRIQTTATDVLHAFAVPALWFKLDAVPGRLNEKTLTITKPGVFFGQCSELCGAKHGFMPIAVEAVSPDKFAAWVKAQGGTMPASNGAGAPAEKTAAPAANDNATTTPAVIAAATK